MVTRIICIGDSITFGVGEAPCVGWAGRLKKFFEVLPDRLFLYNLGIPGDTSSDILRRIDIELDSRLKARDVDDKNIIVLSVGTNDSKYDLVEGKKTERLTDEVFSSNLGGLIDKIESKNIQRIFLMTIPPVDEKRTQPYKKFYLENSRIDRLNAVIREAASRNDISLIDINSRWDRLDNVRLLFDGVHPTASGYDVMFEIILENLKSLGIIADQAK